MKSIASSKLRVNLQGNVDWRIAWKPERLFPLDMAAFAINASLLSLNSPGADALFDIESAIGMVESSFFQRLGLTERKSWFVACDSEVRVFLLLMTL